MEEIGKVIGICAGAVLRVFSVLRENAVFMRTIGPKTPRKRREISERQQFFFNSPAGSLII
jgi:hypothetical protein